MALDYLRQNTIVVPDYEITSKPRKKSSTKKPIPKGKFSLLLSGNLIVWVVFAVSFMDIKVFSMSGIPIKIPQKLAVNGIVYNETSPSVIISNQVYSVGDVVDGYTVSRITQTQAEFLKNGKTIIRKVR